jgi:cytoskeleton protein RodZ
VTEGTEPLVEDAQPDAALPAGELLRASREAAGLTIAAVAQQLKLAPRQVTALEESDFAALPGRTFVRGFVRNYARLLRLDSEAVLNALPEAIAPAAHDNPSLAPTPRPMGEMPAEAQARPSAARWAIPVALVAVVTVAAVYEIARPSADHPRSPGVDKSAPAAVLAPPVPGTSPDSATTALQNPLAGADQTAASPDNSVGKNEDAPAVSTLPPAADVTNAPIVFTFRGKSWVEVRDATGALILSVTDNAGGTQAVTGRAPFDVVLGNAAAVDVSWLGKSFDTAPFTRQNVAKFTLK